MLLNKVDAKVIRFMRRIAEPTVRIGIFIFFVWFGTLKVLGVSPSSDLIQFLFDYDFPFVSSSMIIILLGIFEIVLGIMFLAKGYEKEVIPLLCIYMIIMSMPLLILPSDTWSNWFVPTIDGLYILENLVITVFALGSAAYLHPLPTETKWD
jgi:uncharacterized membrane protein YkgB